MNDVINLAQKLSLFDERWSPKTIARLNDYEIKVAKLEGDFIWHAHDDTDELFIVLQGQLTIQLRDRDLMLSEGELFVVPRGVEHCPHTDGEVKVLLIEPVGVVNTGDAESSLTASPETV